MYLFDLYATDTTASSSHGSAWIFAKPPYGADPNGISSSEKADNVQRLWYIPERSNQRLEKISKTMMIHSNAAGLTRVSVSRATQIPMGIKGNTHHRENNKGRLSTPV